MNRRTFLRTLPAIAVLAGAPGALVSQQGLIQLPDPQTNIGRPLMQVLKERQSTREFADRPIPRQELSNLLWAAFGVNRPDSGKRTAPSAMNRRETDIYVASGKGLFLYDAGTHALKQLFTEDIRGMTGRQDYVRGAAINLVYVADFARMGDIPEETKVLYSSAGTGFIGQNVYLYCASQGLVTVVRAMIDREALAKTMNLRPDQRITLSQSIGYPKV